MMTCTTPQLPHAQPAYRAAFADADRVLARYAINETPLRLAHFMAQVLHETGGLTILVENLNYRADRLKEVWPRRFKTVRQAKPYAHNPMALANKVYGGRMGNTQRGDGWRFIGRGLLQIVGRDAYQRFGNALGIDLAAHPDLVYGAEHALPLAAEIWTSAGCNPLADADDVLRVTRRINGGTNGLDSRKAWLVKTKAVWLTEASHLRAAS